MRVHFDFSALRGSRWRDYALRFMIGGAITAVAGLIAKDFGPVIGGLFLAFPAIFPAAATLIAKHEEHKKRRAAMDGTTRGRMAAALDARGAAIGTLGLCCFALLTWKLLPFWNALEVLGMATASWLLVSLAIWQVEQKFLR
jgi:hypothetical protein